MHRLVLEAFVGFCPSGMEGCHNDGNPLNNKLENLRWDTRRNNAIDSIKHGTFRGNAKLNKKEIIAIRKSKLKCIELAKKYNVTPATISYIKNYKTWKHVQRGG